MGASDASWDEHDRLQSLTLGPLPADNDTDDDTQSSRKVLSADARLVAERNERRRISLGASGRPVRRVSED